MPILEDIKKFLSPIKLDKLLYLRGVIIYGLWAVNPIIHVAFLEKITEYIETGNELLFKNGIIYYLVFIIVYEILEILMRNWGWSEIAKKTQKNIHNIYVKEFVKLDNTETEKVGVGKVLSILEKGFYTWGYLMDLIIHLGISIIFTIIFTTYALFKLNFSYAIIFLIIYILMNIFSLYINRFTDKYRHSLVDERSNYSKQLLKIINSKFDILKNEKIENEIKKLNKLSDKMIKYNRKMVPYLQIIFRLPIFLVNIAKILVFVFLGNLVLKGEIHISTLVGISGALILINNSIEDSLKLFKSVTRYFPTIKKLWSFFDKTKTIEGYEDGKEFIYKNGDIELKNITFGYSKRKKVFEDFSIKIKGGKITAFIGGIGGGKSTLTKIISCFIQPESGDIIVDGQNLKEVSLKSYYKNIGFLNQDPYIFDGTIYENLVGYLDNDLPEELINEKIENALKIANCDFVYELSKGIETKIGENSTILTLGERQRLNIAKMFLKNPKILIIDEKNSFLDIGNEGLVSKSLYKLFEGRNILIMAHKLTTVKYADEIIILEGGKVIERGNHKELIEKDGYYKKILEQQSGF